MSIKDYLQKKKLEKLGKNDPTGYLNKALNEFFDVFDKIHSDIKVEIGQIKTHTASFGKSIDTKVGALKDELVVFLSNKTDTILSTCIERIDDYLHSHPAEKGDKGDSYILTEEDKQTIADGITVPVVEKVVEKHYTVVEKASETPIVIEASKETGETIANKLNETKESLAVSVIRGLQEELESIKRAIRRKGQVGGGGDIVEAGTGVSITEGSGGRKVISASGLSATFETVSKNLSSVGATLNYTGDNLTSIEYTSGVTKTLNYTGANLTSVVLSGSTPGGISLTKTLSYTGDNLTGVAYS